MRSMWRRGGLTWWQLAVRVWKSFWTDQLPGRCAELAYYFLFSVFPLLLFLTTLLGYLAGPDTRLRVVLFRYLGHFSPSPEVTDLLHGTLDQITAGRGGATLSLSLVAALWVASTGMLAAARTLNSACGIEETRPWWHRRLVSMALTVVFTVLIICALTVILYGHHIGEALADSVGVGSAFVAAWHVVRWPLVLVFVLVSFDLIYNFAPDVGAVARRGWGTPGAVIGMCLWLAASFGFRLYLNEMRGYGSTYGSLTAVVVLLLWFYLTAVAILVGGEVNSVIARQAAEPRRRGPGRGAPGAPGARGGGRRGGGALR